MLHTVEGTVKNGKVELDETPAGVEGLRVRVTFLPPQQSRDGASTAGGRIVYGMFRGAWEPTTEEDFRAAEWRGDPDERAEHGGEVRR